MVIYGCSTWLFFLWPLLSDPYEHVHDEVKRKRDVIWHQTRLYLNWLDLDKVSLKLASKNLVLSKLKPRFKIFSVLF